jgi:type I restriction-modification system DNA methylase subunit
MGDDRLNLRLKLSILSWLQLFVIRTIWRKVRTCTRRCCLLPKTRESIKVYRDVAGLCKIATLDKIEAQGWSLNPGRYVGVAQRQEAEDFDFATRLEELNEELEILNVEARELEERIAENVVMLLEGD